MTEPVRRAALVAVALLSVAVLGACGGASDAPPASSPSSASSAAPGSAAAASGPASGASGSSGPASSASSRAGWPFAPAPTDDEKKAQLERLAKDAGPLKSNWTPPGKSERYGHAEGLIDAPYDAVRARLVDFPHYKELAGPKFKKVSVVDKQPGGTDLYFQLPIMKGIVTIWYVTRFPAARPAAGGGEVVEGSFVKGNIKDMQIVFTVRPGPDEKKTILQCDLSLALSIPAPQDAVDEELRDACGDAVNAVRTRVAASPP